MFLASSLLAVLLYLVLTGILGTHLRGDRGGLPGLHARVLALGGLAWALHGLGLSELLFADQQINLALTAAGALVTWLVVSLFLLLTALRPTDSLGVVIFPVTGIALGLALLFPGDQPLAREFTPALAMHLVVALLAYALLSVAVVQALLLWWQERQLRDHHAGRLLGALPSLETMERLLFQLIHLGFGLLTLTLLSGILFSEELFGRPFRFTHHVVLALMAWTVFGILVVGHWRRGWRGRSAVRWILGAFSLLVLAYFGTKFVFEIVLGR
ncbi:MAG: cytochrome c biogenesis protein CcsA [Gammaproteobacteria bacterium]|jgi:ABC-type uncharacterized transport system permease subunit|nr:cytochrome c biogenesis protein CcsA [Gammaproteobacteria bacterium]